MNKHKSTLNLENVDTALIVLLFYFVGLSRGLYSILLGLFCLIVYSSSVIVTMKRKLSYAKLSEGFF